MPLVLYAPALLYLVLPITELALLKSLVHDFSRFLGLLVVYEAHSEGCNTGLLCSLQLLL